jgi:hypothetical protein
MEDEERQVMELNIPSSEVESFMKDNRALMVAETLSASEELIYKDLDTIEVIRINIIQPRGRTVLDCKLKKTDVLDGVEKLMEWALENEEYEMCHRIKLLTEYINRPKEDVRRKTRGRPKKAK